MEYNIHVCNKRKHYSQMERMKRVGKKKTFKNAIAGHTKIKNNSDNHIARWTYI